MESKASGEIIVAHAGIVGIAERNDRLSRRRRKNMRYYGTAAYLVAGIEIMICIAMFMFLQMKDGSFWMFLAAGLAISSLHPIWEGTRKMIGSFTPAAVISLSEEEAEKAWTASNRLLAMLGADPQDKPDPTLAAEAQTVVDTLKKLSTTSLVKKGMYGYPPRHTTGESGVNYESDDLGTHVKRVKRALADLMTMVAGSQDVPGTDDELQTMIGEVAAPLRVALRYHGIRLRDLDDGRTTTILREVKTFDAPRITPPDPIMEMEARLGRTEQIVEFIEQRGRVAQIPREDMDADLAIEAATVIDRHLPSLANTLVKAHDAGDAAGRSIISTDVARALEILTDSLRIIADTHAEQMRQRLEEQKLFLTSRQTQDPFSGKNEE